ncbi:hypothetical protein [Saccharothrix coeruleofusca]|uniref:Uncharacterized protein n=1 Tax=Saccharothrix coeruleofusca TaxID=33919 RepID=A0A918AHP3_9PSEU|nr:hypothetical protein [Saccharothrix coeruleofusca]GGP38599.1 hypothetical protein GCM10010185_07630 [Saccharothrix coeruleofusca]
MEDVPRLFAIVQDAEVAAWGLEFTDSAHVISSGHHLSTRSAHTALRYFQDADADDPQVVWVTS